MYLRYINQANDKNCLTLVLFQKINNMDEDVTLFAWKTIKHCGSVDDITFTYLPDLQICVADAQGNFSPKLTANSGTVFTVTTDARGFLQLLPSESTSRHEIEIENQLAKGIIDVYSYRSRQPLLKRGPIVPGEEAVFSFEPVLYVALLQDIEEGKALPPTAMAKATAFSLLGLQGADIVLRGGGTDKNATPYIITLENLIL